MYTIENTFNEILSDELFAKRHQYLYAQEFIDFVPEDLRNISLAELKRKLNMPWGGPYLSDDMVGAANLLHDFTDATKYEFVQLWTEKQDKDYFPTTDGTREGVALLILKETFKAGRPIALIVPGGGYSNVALAGEGMRTAEKMAAHGYAVAIMNYRVAPAHYPEPQEDMALAVKYLRRHGSEYGLKTDDLMAIGYSAGGHLVASESCYCEEIDEILMNELKNEFPGLYEKYKGISAKVNKLVPSYPVISCVSENHEDSFQKLTGGDEALRDKMSIELHAKADYPKTFVWACDDDFLVPPSNAKRLYERLTKLGVEVMYKTYPTGGHGCNVGEGTSAEGWIDTMVEFMK